MSSVEIKMTELIEEFKVKLSGVAEDVIEQAYGDILPHVENDTFMNVQYRSQAVINNVISGKFEVVDDNSVSVYDGNNMSVEIKITDGQWDNVRKSLLEIMPACPKDLEIASLKKTIELMEKSSLF